MKKFCAAFVFSLVSSVLAAQNQISLYQMNDIVPQASFINPAFTSNYKVNIGIPTVFFMNNLGSVSISDMVGENDLNGNVQFDEDSFIANLDDDNDFDTYVGVSINAGFHTGLGYFSLGLTQRTTQILNFPKEFAEVGLKGLDDRNFRLSDISVDSDNYLEYSVGYSNSFVPNLRTGIRLKYLSGIFKAEGNGFAGFVSSNFDSISVSANNDLILRTSGIPLLEDNCTHARR
jgi:hypothetical protein